MWQSLAWPNWRRYLYWLGSRRFESWAPQVIRFKTRSAITCSSSPKKSTCFLCLDVCLVSQNIAQWRWTTRNSNISHWCSVAGGIKSDVSPMTCSMMNNNTTFSSITKKSPCCGCADIRVASQKYLAVGLYSTFVLSFPSCDTCFNYFSVLNFCISKLPQL